MKECSDRKSELTPPEGYVLEILKIWFIFFGAVGIGSYRAREVCMCI